MIIMGDCSETCVWKDKNHLQKLNKLLSITINMLNFTWISIFVPLMDKENLQLHFIKFYSNDFHDKNE